MKTINRGERTYRTTAKKIAQDANAWADKLRREREKKPEPPKDKK